MEGTRRNLQGWEPPPLPREQWTIVGRRVPRPSTGRGRKVVIMPLDAGHEIGVRISLRQIRHSRMLHWGVELDLALYLNVCPEGECEDLVFDAVANENEATVRELD